MAEPIPLRASPALTHFDVLIVGAGLSGVGAAYYLQERCPGKTYAILEGREAMGGTWDLFRYPGIRSDSDMYTLGYAFKPWREPKAIADGPSILAYIEETARDNGIDRHIRYSHWVEQASWDSDAARWTLRVKTPKGRRELTCSFLFGCAGYYRYDRGYTPELEGIERFEGPVIHPQHWPEDLDYAGKRVIVIGSGATAVTLAPELSKDAAGVVMLQRSPTYMVRAPSEDRVANWLRERLPPRVAYGLSRWKNIGYALFSYQIARRRPERVKRWLISKVRDALSEGYDVGTHFTPHYDPWDQRICLVPDDDLFIAINEGRLEVVTDHIDTITETGIRLRSGAELEADIIVTATGLDLHFMGGIDLEVDGRHIVPGDQLLYRGAMVSDIPNLAFAVGYTNASWTLKVDLTCAWVCRVLNHMDRHGFQTVAPRRRPEDEPDTLISLTAGYILRAAERLPKQGKHMPWKVFQNYLLDVLALRATPLEDGVLEFGRARAASHGTRRRRAARSR